MQLKKHKQRQIAVGWGLVLLTVVLLVGCPIRRKYKVRQLRQHYKITTCTIISVDVYRGEKGTNRKDASVSYTYTIGNNSYENNDDFQQVNSHIEELLKGKSFPVAYDTTDYNNSEILIIRGQFYNLGLSFPDSLAASLDIFH